MMGGGGGGEGGAEGCRSAPPLRIVEFPCAP